MAADSIVLDGGVGTVTFPTALAGGNNVYVVMLTGESATAPYISDKTDVDGAFASFEITGDATDTVHWTVIKKGKA